MRHSLIVALIFLSGCTWSPAAKQRKQLIQEKHAENEAFAERVQDADPAKRPSPAQMQVWIIMNSKDWESLDRLENHWEPRQRFIPVAKGAANGQ